MSEAFESREFDRLLDYLKRTRGFDFDAYKRPSLMRRVQKRMQMVNIDRFDDYTDYLEVHPDEFAQLFNVILINVTTFFRDDTTWDYLRDDVMPTVVQSRADGEPIRVWTAACASGEETYSIAMILAELLGREAYRERVKIYATDVDDQALSQARAAAYPEKQVEGVPPHLLDRYFVRENGRFVFDKDLRRSVIFGRHDLVQDAPISRINLLLCRNALMYFNTEVQTRILARFHFALAESGVLFLGRAEMLVARGQMFAPIDLRCRIFRKLSKGDWRDRMVIMNRASGDESSAAAADRTALMPAAFDSGVNAQIVVDAGGVLAMFNERARILFGLAAGDLGRPMQDLELSCRPVELRSMMGQASDQRRPVAMKDIEWKPHGRESQWFDVDIVPLVDGGGRSIGASISFTDVSRVKELQQLLNRSKHDLETAYEELQSTNEELETTNEELQSTVEELETTNEELQSINEELETMNEELQSTNEELQTINDELRQRSEEFTRANDFLESVLTGVRSGVIVVDRELHVIAWNHRAEDLWGLRSDEVRGQNFFKLDIGLPLDQLHAGIRACLGGDGHFSELIVAATNRRGRSIMCKVTASPLVGADQAVRGVILMLEEQTAASVRTH